MNRQRFSTVVAGVAGILAIPALAQDRIGDTVEVGRGLHHRTWQRTVARTLPDGRAWSRVQTFTDLANGLHYVEANTGQLVESQEMFELFQDGVIARRGQTRVILAPNINSPAAVDVVSADGSRFTSVVLGLGLYDRATGASELIAELKDAVGELHPPNTVLYRDSFDGVAADLRYTYKRTGLEQDVILREGFEMPPNFNPATTVVEVWTEFTAAPAAERTPEVKAGMESERIRFGDMRIGSGRAFSIEAGADGPSVPVSVQWMQINGRTFLVEGVRHADIGADLARLRVRQAAVRKPAGAMQVHVGQPARPFPPAKMAKVKSAGQKIETASVAPPSRGLLIDYDLQNNIGSLRLAGSDTVHILGTVIVTNLVIEGGCVLKFSSNAVLEVASGGTIDLQTSPYLPILFTAKDDQTAGAVVGTDALTGYYANPALRLHNGTYLFKHLRFSHAREAVNLDSGSVTIRHGQFTFCQKAFGLPGTDGIAENNLFYSVSNVVYGQNFRFHGRHLTVDQCTSLTGDTQTNGTVTLTNSLLVHMTNWGVSPSITTNLVVRTSNSPFQAVGAGSHYLTAYRNLGTTNIPVDLLKDLRKMTTYPPQIIASAGTGVFSTNNLDLLPYAQRDTDALDLGAHYQPIDAVIAGLSMTNATLTASNGVVIATHNVDGFGLGLHGSAKFFSGGRPDRPNRLVRYNTVQEQATTNWATAGSEWRIITAWGPSPAASQISARFTHWATLASGGVENIFAASATDTGTHYFTDCEFYNADVSFYRPTLNVTNCLFSHAGLILADYEQINPNVRHTTFHGGIHGLARSYGGTWTFRDNLFDAVSNSQQTAVLTHNYNGYTTNSSRLTNAAPNDVVLVSVTNVAYQIGPLGRFYLPTNLASHSPLLDSGSAAASTLRFYHFTTVTNQTREGSSTVDLGYHSVATDGNGIPLDSDNDGVPDVFEDADGDGVADAGESDWQAYNSLFGIGTGPGLVTFTPLK